MAKITRQTAKIFGSSASTNQIAEFGSLAASSPVRYSGATATPALVQALANWLDGWSSALEGVSSIALEDLNGFCFVDSYQIAYLLQEGIAEWDSATTYFIGSLVQDGLGNIYTSLTNTNLNNALTSSVNWQIIKSISALQISSSSSNFSTNSATPVDVTNLTVTITTYGRPVYVGLVSDGGVSSLEATGAGPGTKAQGIFSILRGSTFIGSASLSTDGPSFNAYDPQIPVSSLSAIDIIAAGTYTYKIQAQMNATGGSAGVNYAKLVAYEI